jgi:basic amino acid/polyamine antiporter, APA family
MASFDNDSANIVASSSTSSTTLPGLRGTSRSSTKVVNTGAPRATLRLYEAIAIIVGIVIGAGIFKAPSLVAANTENAFWMFAAWALGGLISLIGALCYAELATSFPNAGGDYHFLKRAYGRTISFLFAWARFAVITTGSIALLAFVFGDYMAQIYSFGASSANVYAIVAVIALTWLNVRGLHASATTQTWLTAVEVLGLLLIVIAGLFLVTNGVSSASPAQIPTAANINGSALSNAPSLSAFGLAMVFVLLTYGGWNEAAYLSAELKDERRNMVRALTYSIILITALYLLVNWAYWHGLGTRGMAESKAVAADLLNVAFGRTGALVMAAMVAVAALTSMNATMIVGARTNFAAAQDWSIFQRIGQWDEARGTPVNAVLLQGAAATVLVMIGAAVGGGAEGGGFRAMVEFTAPVFWLFFLLSGVALFVLRRKYPDLPQRFKVPLYPFTPIVFCLVCAYMLWSSLSYVYSQELGGLNAAWIGVIVLLSGGVIHLLLRSILQPKPTGVIHHEST